MTKEREDDPGTWARPQLCSCPNSGVADMMICIVPRALEAFAAALALDAASSG